MNRVHLKATDWIPLIVFLAILVVGVLNRVGVIDISDELPVPEVEVEDVLLPCMSESGPLKGAGDFDKEYLLRPRI